MAERFNVRFFDRVTQIRFHGATELSNVELSSFTELTRVLKPVKHLPFESGSYPKDEAMTKYVARMNEHIPVQAAAELSQVFSDCQVKNIEHDQVNWSAEVDVNQFACRANTDK